MKGKQRSYVVVLIALLSACELPEKPYPAPVGLTTEAAMGMSYENVVYFNLEQDSAVLIRPRDAYDLCWDPSTTSFGLRLNSSGFGRFKRSSSYDFNAVLDTAQFEGSWQWSKEGSELWDQDLGRWLTWSNAGWSPVFAILPGVDALGATRPMWRIQVRRYTNGIGIRYAPFGDPMSADSLRLFSLDGIQFVHFNRGKVPRDEVEPESWDFFMGQYTDQDTVPETLDVVPYLVRGVLIPSGRSAARVARLWDNLPADWAYTEPLVQQTNVIGFRWKYFSFETSSYVTNSEAVFLLERPDKSRYALRFLDFYNSRGQRGFVQTQWKPL